MRLAKEPEFLVVTVLSCCMKLLQNYVDPYENYSMRTNTQYPHSLEAVRLHAFLTSLLASISHILKLLQVRTNPVNPWRSAAFQPTCQFCTS